LRANLTAFIVTGILLCLVALVVSAFLAGKDRNLLFVLPSEISSRRFDVEAIEEFAEKEFPLSYEIPGSERVSLTHAEYQVIVIATNSSYPYVLAFSMMEGAFFSKQAWTGKQRHAVLNEKAAFTVFGSCNITGSRFRMRNETWLVTGVISDGDEDKERVYIPSSVRGGEAGALALAGGDEAYMRDRLKTLGIQDGGFDYINLGTQYRQLWERAEIILLLFLAIFFLSLLKPLIGGFSEARSSLKENLSRLYPGEILKKNMKAFHKASFFTMSLIAIPVLALFLFLHIASVCLPWQDIPSLANLNREFFFLQLSRIHGLEMISRFFFGFSLAFLAGFFLRVIASPIERKTCRHNALQ